MASIIPNPSDYNNLGLYLYWKIMRKIVNVEEFGMVSAGASTWEWVAHNPAKEYQDLGFSKIQIGLNETYTAHNLNVREWHENYLGQTVFGWNLVDILPIRFGAYYPAT
jgi:hypothetical protein